MEKPIDLSHPHKTERQRTLDRMNDWELQRAQRYPGAFGANSRQVQREIEEEIEDRRRERERTLVTDSPGMEDPLDQYMEEDIDLASDDLLYDLETNELSGVGFEKEGQSNSSEEDVDYSELLELCEKYDIGTKQPPYCLDEFDYDLEDVSDSTEDSDESENSAASDDSSQSSGSGGGAITGGVVGGAVGSVGGPAGAAVGAAAGAFLGKLFD